LLSAALAARRIDRRYAALSWGHLREDRMTIEGNIGRDPNNRHRMAIIATGKPARTEIDRLARFDGGDLLRCKLHTGRTHQIRVHLSSIGHPVMGDDTYGGGGGRRVTGLPAGRHALHAAMLSLTHPITSERLTFRSPLPADLEAALRAIAGAHQPPTGADLLSLYKFFPEPGDPDDARGPRVMLVSGGGTTVAMDARVAREVTPRMSVIRLPGAPTFVSGVVNVRGTLVPLVDLGCLLGFEHANPSGWVVVLDLGGRRCALAVDSLPVLRAADAPPCGRPDGRAFLTREVRVAGVMHPLLDVDALADDVLLQ
jgi:chemotaxis signal transduction protein